MKTLLIALALLWMPLAAEAKLWTVDAAASKLTFTGKQTGTPFTGTFGAYQATVDLDPAMPEKAQIMVSIDMASAKTGDKQRDQALPGKDWFDVAAHKLATFQSTSVTKKDATNFEAKGMLTIKGVTKEVVLPFTLAPTLTGGMQAKGSVTVDRTDYKVGLGEWAGDEWVAKPVTIAIDIVAN